MLIATKGAKSQEIALQDDFEAGELSSIWVSKNLPEGALRRITTPTRSGKRAIEIQVQRGANTAIGATAADGA